MPSEWLWHLNRAAGFLAYLYLWLAALSGLIWDGRRYPLLAILHPWAAAWAGYATVVHLVALRVERFVGYTWADLLLPLGGPVTAGPPRFALALGILSAYLLLGVLVTTWLRARAWRALHLLSYPAWALGLYHGLAAGTDARAPWALSFYAATALALLAGGAWRWVRAGKEV